MPCARPRLGTWSSRPGFLPADHQLITHTSCMCTVKVLTKLEATDGGAAPTIPQVCGGVRRWVGGSLAHATNRASLDSAPCTTEAAVLPSASRSSCSTSTPSRRSAPRTGASRSRCWCAASHHCASVCTDPSSTRLTLGKACGCCHVVVPCIPRSLPMYISGHLPQGGLRGRRQDGSDTRCGPGSHAHVDINAGAAGHPRAHRLSHTAPTDSYPVLVHAPQAPHAPYPRSDSTRTGSRAPQATSG